MTTSHGNTTKPDKLKFECSFCGCEWEAKSNEFKMEETVVGPSKNHWISYKCNCPSCNRETTVLKDKSRD